MKIVVFLLFLSAHCELTVALKKQHTFINRKMPWSDAQIFCREKYDDLSTVESQETILWLTSYINDIITKDTGVISFQTETWVGLKKISTNKWQWSDGSELNSQLAILNQTFDLDFNHCATIQYNRLVDSRCENIYPFICYKWVPKLILVREKKSWEEALQYCRTHHTDLASLPTYLHLIQVNQTTAVSETLSVWTGLRFLAGSWFWVSGKPLGDLVQLPACPANYLYCGSRNRETRRWENRDCMEKLNFVCY